ncbi:MAG: tetratricopeptide repeat protein [Acidobacteriia bacterium]|nr:tetratricopeptide repeat protein [Terriglobia bacterium]
MTQTPDDLIRLGYQARREKRLADAKRIFLESVELCREAANQSLLAGSLVGLGQIERDLKDTRAALQHYSEAVGICRTENNPLRLAHTIRHLADILREDGALEGARPHYEEALRIYRQEPDAPPLDMANAIRGFALLREGAGESKEASDLWREARALYDAVNVKAGIEESNLQIARLTAR